MNVVKILKSLADETRLSIIKEIISKREISCKEIQEQFELSQPAMSHHFHKLIDSGILQVQKKGTSHYYSINRLLFSSLGINSVKLFENI
jgi:ArsR family transcriptional regulator, arsenate/arsenite/antimonite-responsive transcriptional repressor